MGAQVNVLRIRKRQVLVDCRNLLDHLAEASPDFDRRGTFVEWEELRQSLSPGRYSVLQCRGCAEEGLRWGEDVGVMRFQVSHTADRVKWAIDLGFGEKPVTVRFAFHRPQYDSEIAGIESRGREPKRGGR